MEKRLSPLEAGTLTAELHEFGVRMMRMNIKRAHPQATDEEIETRLTEWLHTRPGAEHGDADGVPSRRFATSG
jgi:hypothetical protein